MQGMSLDFNPKQTGGRGIKQDIRKSAIFEEDKSLTFNFHKLTSQPWVRWYKNWFGQLMQKNQKSSLCILMTKNRKKYLEYSKI